MPMIGGQRLPESGQPLSPCQRWRIPPRAKRPCRFISSTLTTRPAMFQCPSSFNYSSLHTLMKSRPGFAAAILQQEFVQCNNLSLVRKTLKVPALNKGFLWAWVIRTERLAYLLNVECHCHHGLLPAWIISLSVINSWVIITAIIR